MTKEQILSMQAGRELDAFVAEKVMGWRIETHDGYPGEPMEPDWVDENTVMCEVGEWEPSTDISAAWEVVEKMQVTKLVRVNAADGDYVCKIGGDLLCFRYVAKTAPEAICKAALLAVMNL